MFESSASVTHRCPCTQAWGDHGFSGTEWETHNTDKTIDVTGLDWVRCPNM